MPMIAYWPGSIAAGTVSDEPITAMDFLPTFAGLAGASLPIGHKIDGLDVWDVIAGKSGARCSIKVLLYYHKESKPRAARCGKWKIVLRDRRGQKISPELYDLSNDVGEEHNVAMERREVVAELIRLIDAKDC